MGAFVLLIPRSLPFRERKHMFLYGDCCSKHAEAGLAVWNMTCPMSVPMRRREHAQPLLGGIDWRCAPGSVSSLISAHLLCHLPWLGSGCGFAVSLLSLASLSSQIFKLCKCPLLSLVVLALNSVVWCWCIRVVVSVLFTLQPYVLYVALGILCVDSCFSSHLAASAWWLSRGFRIEPVETGELRALPSPLYSTGTLGMWLWSWGDES